MTWKELLRELRECAEEDGALNGPVCLHDLLDYCGILGLPGASELYAFLLKTEQRAIRAKLRLVRGGKKK